ncbi:hypothetical protein ABWL39_07695 [Chitinivorax sp. PXF-14]|uniref:hypothetical protein n=1 Tax=Chitinivorax sp. PXF-14 TaxID=3230488 RepID=UPI00346618B2
MPIIYYVGQKDVSIPNVLSRVYKYGTLTDIPTIRANGKILTIDVKKRINDAWKHMEGNCAKNKSCNDYFSKLHKGMTLSDILSSVSFTVYQLMPKEGHTDDELPLANSAGRDFALSIYAFLDQVAGTQNTTPALAATILHEIAHYAGATTNRADENALQAENALIHCGLKQYFNPDAKG